VGLQHPITVRARDGAYVLVAGGHRFAACGALNMQKIPANVVDLNSLEAELLEIDENLARNELSPAERKAATVRRKAIYEELHPETRSTTQGGDGRRKETRRQLGDETVAERFTKQTAEATGRSERTIQRDAQHGRALGAETLDKIARTSLDREGEIDALAKLPDAERESLVARAAAAELVSAKPPAQPAAPAVAPEALTAGVGGAGDEPAQSAPAGTPGALHCKQTIKPAAPAVASEAPVAAGEVGEPAQSATPDPDDDDALWRAFLAQGDRAIAMAVYDAGPIDGDIIDKVSDVIGAWQRLGAFLKAELAKDSESWE
jgi:ParB-like chromosome segregation protein Spo0J